MSDWRYLAFAEPSGAYLGEIQLSGVEVRRVLSGPARLTGSLVPGQSANLLLPWAVSVYAEDAAGNIVGGGFLTPPDFAAAGPSIDCVGRSGYPHGMPWTAEPLSLVHTDPLDIVRTIWAHLQDQPSGNIDMHVDSTTSPVRIGEPERDVSFTTGAGEAVSFDAGPFSLDWWSTTDLGKIIDDLATSTPFDYLEHTTWAPDGEHLTHHLRLGHPTIGSRRTGPTAPRFALGENVLAVPPLTGTDEDYASEIHALGAGEGRTMIHAPLSRPTDGVRRVAIFTDKTARSTSALAASARAELAWRDGAPRLQQLTVVDHPHAPLGSFDVGDEIYVEGSTPWLELDRWVRVVEMSVRPQSTSVDVTVQEV